MPPVQSSSDTTLVTRLLPYTFLCTIGPAVTAATSLFVVRTVMYRIYGHDHQVPDKDNERRVEALTGTVMAGLAVLDGLTSFLSTSYVQRLADRHGRRPLLIFLPILAMVSTASLMIAYKIHNPVFIWVLLIANGIFVSASTKAVFIPTLCVADIASTKERTRFYSLLEAVSLLGPGTAYVVSALISRYIGNVLVPYYVALGCQAFAGLYSAVVIPETLSAEKQRMEDDPEDGHEQEQTIEEVLVAPVKPLRLVLPQRDSSGALEWRLSLVTLSVFLTTCGTVFIATASLLFLSDKFNFDPEKNSWVLAYLTFSRFAYLTLIFPLILKAGRALYKMFDTWRRGKPASSATERAPLLQRKESYATQNANYFDIIMAFLSVSVDALSLVLVAMSQSSKQVLISFSALAFGAGDNPSFRSVFVSAVPADRASESLAALDMIISTAKLASPLVLGAIYAAFAEIGKPEMMFLAAGGFCLVGAAFLIPLLLAGARRT